MTASSTRSPSSTRSGLSCSVVGNKPRKDYEGTLKLYDTRIGKKHGIDYYAEFLGIPYAKNPLVGSKQFQAPEPESSPEETPASLPAKSGSSPAPRSSPSTSHYKADVTGKKCTQLVDWTGQTRKYEGSPDCLYLNIFVPQKPELITKPLPVLVYIHGGGFLYGSNSHEEYTPDSIIQHDIVFVTMNYRIGIFGFLNMHTKDCPGNTGLKDQVRALEWIRDNIACFKGDPNNVTISGCSAGGTCVNLHLISPMSKDLFHKAIIQSGGVYSTWGYRGHKREMKRALNWQAGFREMSLTESDPVELQECACRLLQADRELRHPQSLSPFFGPTVESYKEDGFITEDMDIMMQKVDHEKPILAGITKSEGIHLFLSNQNINYTAWINDDIKFHQLLMDNFRWSSKVASNVMDTIRNKYFPQRIQSSEQSKMIQFSNFVRDIFFHRFYENFKFGPENTVHENLYVYQFEHYSELSQARNAEPFCEATHADELRYLYPSIWAKKVLGKFIYEGERYYNREIRDVMMHMCSLWANFCKNGVPESDLDTNKLRWKRHTVGNPCYLAISRNLTLKDGPLFKKEWKWLNDLVEAQPKVESLQVTPVD